MLIVLFMPFPYTRNTLRVKEMKRIHLNIVLSTSLTRLLVSPLGNGIIYTFWNNSTSECVCVRVRYIFAIKILEYLTSHLRYEHVFVCACVRVEITRFILIKSHSSSEMECNCVKCFCCMSWDSNLLFLCHTHTQKIFVWNSHRVQNSYSSKVNFSRLKRFSRFWKSLLSLPLFRMNWFSVDKSHSLNVYGIFVRAMTTIDMHNHIRFTNSTVTFIY